MSREQPDVGAAQLEGMEASLSPGASTTVASPVSEPTASLILLPQLGLHMTVAWVEILSSTVREILNQNRGAELLLNHRPVEMVRDDTRFKPTAFWSNLFCRHT